MITLYQESVPFSNKWFNGKISQDQKYINPVIIPYTTNATLGENVMETVIYINNDDQGKYYKNVVVSLMTEVGENPLPTSGSLNFTGGNVTLSLNSSLDNPVGLAYEYPGGLPNGPVTLNNVYMSTYVPVINMPNIDVKFSYGYDELSLVKWNKADSILLIPTIGTIGLGNTSYIPIRMRITTKDKTPFITNRNYFIDISYSEELTVGNG